MLTGCWCSSISKMPAYTARRGSTKWRRLLQEAQPCQHTCRTSEIIQGNTVVATILLHSVASAA